MIFRLSKNVPDVYVKESRDFQLLCNSFDAVQNSVKYDTDSILNSIIVTNCVDSYVPFLQTKLGFFTNTTYSNETLRNILQLFPLIVRNKGSIYGIQLAVYVYLHALGLDITSKVEVDNVNYVISISFTTKSMDVSILTELLEYVIPAGYKLKYGFYEPISPQDNASVEDSVEILCRDNLTSVNVYNDRTYSDISSKHQLLNIDGVSTSSTATRKESGNE